VDQARRLKELPRQQAKATLRGPRFEQENSQLRRLIAELNLDNLLELHIERIAPQDNSSLRRE
jgi:hypothetical protein